VNGATGAIATVECIPSVRRKGSIEAELAGEMAIEALIAVAERSASCEVYGLLMRSHGEYVTERACDNSKFVENLVCDVALALKQEPRAGVIAPAKRSTGAAARYTLGCPLLCRRTSAFGRSIGCSGSILLNNSTFERPGIAASVEWEEDR